MGGRREDFQLRYLERQLSWPVTDSDADNKVADVDAALQAPGGDHVAFGYLTTTITVAETDRQRVEEKARAIVRIVNGLGFTVRRADLRAHSDGAGNFL